MYTNSQILKYMSSFEVYRKNKICKMLPNMCLITSNPMHFLLANLKHLFCFVKEKVNPLFVIFVGYKTYDCCRKVELQIIARELDQNQVNPPYLFTPN